MTLKAPKGMPSDIKEAFDGIVEVLTESGVIGSIEKSDLYGVEIVATQIVRMRNAQKFIQKHGEYYETVNGSWTKFPAVVTEQQASAIINKWSQKLGLAPADRAKLATLDTSGNEDLSLD
jgi:P27 family predicted phage terminase small subunit